MHLILTHEQADFDAVAALLAARLLDPQARAVLPRRVNRNVRAFLTLYGDRLPFTTHDELPPERVGRVTLVDTQSLPSLKGLEKGAQVHVVDHHPATTGIDPTWTLHLDEVGATTTLLAEDLEAAEAQIDPVEATLLLTGIYEDTGSLSYGGTTARDVRAVAWLLDQGASLTLAADGLNQPLSAGQRLMYDRLLESAETYTIHGVPVVVAAAEAGGYGEEVSILAHKLRDLFDPAGLFVLVGLDGHVQLVARSSSDSVDVARISERFGGGGHARAAAALVRGKSLNEVRQALLALLPEVVRPVQTVGDIMSVAPQLLDPAVTIGEAADRMRRFGHEGYPVVEDGKVIGLLTRRAVDRAAAHGLSGQPVRTVMDPGDLVAFPDDSIERLQRAMVERDWGQVPVVDRRQGHVIGIVTRTDLLRSLSGPPGGRAGPGLAAELERALPPARRGLLRLVAQAAEARRFALYVVGGFVRDLLLHAPSVDFDLVVEGDAIAVAHDLARSFGGRVGSHRRFGTAKWLLDRGEARLRSALSGDEVFDGSALPVSLDFVSARAEFYAHPTALPSVQPGSIKLDLHRRDFSINTLAIRLDGSHYGQLLDPWGGGRDLRLRQIRALHSISFIDDPTRMLRAVRLEHRLGFEIEPRTLELLGQALPLLHRVSGERLRGEIELILAEPHRSAMIARLQSLGLLAAIHPGLTWDTWLETRFEESSRVDMPAAWRLAARPAPDLLCLLLWTLRLDPAQAEGVGARLREPQTTISAMRSGAEVWGGRAEWSREPRPSRIVRAFEGCPEPSLAAAWLALADDDAARRVLDGYLSRWRFVQPGIDGHRLRALGIPPGPIYGRVLADLREGWLDGAITNEAEERARLESLLGAGSAAASAPA
ncbi:MAG TPA: CBS domain-containing protein [Anaerolineales bacterium]|nr:CBS domain-containing protein [Anaerolineales bacterium]